MLHVLPHHRNSKETIKILQTHLDDEGVYCPPTKGKITKTSSLQDEGKKLFQNFQYDSAIECYDEALNESNVPKETKCILHGNKAACYFKLKLFQDTIDEASKSLDIDSCYFKSLYLRSRAFGILEKFNSAFVDAQSMIKVSPKNGRAHELHKQWLKKLKVDQKMKEMSQGLCKYNISS